MIVYVLTFPTTRYSDHSIFSYQHASLCHHFNDHTISPPTERAMVTWPRPTTEHFCCLFTVLNHYNFTTINHAVMNIFVHMALSTFWIIFERQFRRYGIPRTRNHQGQNKTPLFLRTSPECNMKRPEFKFLFCSQLVPGLKPLARPSPLLGTAQEPVWKICFY